MSKLLLFDYKCTACGTIFEELVRLNDHTPQTCTNCKGPAVRTISGTRLDPDMGLTNDFPTMAAKWAKKTRARAKTDKVGGPNLWMY